jgi:hypothetical protein
MNWRGGRGCMFWPLLVLLPPLGVMMLLRRANIICGNCGYDTGSPVPPEGTALPEREIDGFTVLVILLIAILIIGIALVSTQLGR